MWKQIEDYNYSINEYGIVRNDATGRIKEHYKNNDNGSTQIRDRERY